MRARKRVPDFRRMPNRTSRRRFFAHGGSPDSVVGAVVQAPALAAGLLLCGGLQLVSDAQPADASGDAVPRTLRALPVRDPAWQVITSAASDERALDTVAGGKFGRRGAEDDNSPFVAALCRGLRGGPTCPSRAPGRASSSPMSCTSFREPVFAARTSAGPFGAEAAPVVAGRARKKDSSSSGRGTPHHAAPALELTEGNNPYRGLGTLRRKTTKPAPRCSSAGTRSSSTSTSR